MLFHTGDKLYLPPPILRLEFSTLMKMAFFTPLSNHLDSAVSIVLSNSTVCSGCSVWICFATSEVMELGLHYSLNINFRDLSVSAMYVASHSSHLPVPDPAPPQYYLAQLYLAVQSTSSFLLLCFLEHPTFLISCCNHCMALWMEMYEPAEKRT